MSFDKNSLNGEDILLLINKAQAGDSGALSELVVKASPFVHVLVKQFLKNSSNMTIESDDLFQEGMLGVLSAIKSFDSLKNTAFKTYVSECVHNRLVSAARKRSESSVFTYATVPLENSAENVYQSTSVEEITIGRESFERICDYINSRLSKKEREVLKLFLSGLSYEEIARKTGSSVKSVDNSLQRVRQKIKNYNL